LLDAVSAGLRNVAKVKLDRLPRMADFMKWITAAERWPWMGSGGICCGLYAKPR
jgi:hypothetical protein